MPMYMIRRCREPGCIKLAAHSLSRPVLCTEHLKLVLEVEKNLLKQAEEKEAC